MIPFTISSQWFALCCRLREHVRLSVIKGPMALIAITAAVAACNNDNTAPAPPNSVSVVSGNTLTDSVGGTTTDSVVVLVRNSHGNPVPNVAVNWAPGSGTVDSSSTNTNAEGKAQVKWTFSFNSLAQAGVTTTSLTATVTGVTPATITATAGPGNPTSLLITASSNNQTGVHGTTLATPLMVRVVDQHGFSVPNDTVTWTAAGGSGSLGATATSSPSATLKTKTDANGMAQAYWTLGTTLGTNTVSVTANAAAPGGGTTTIGPVQFIATGT